MTKNPFLNALAAIVYIVLIVSIMNLLGSLAPEGEDGIMAPILGLSLFTLSAAVMGYIFIGMPLRLYLEGEKQAAVGLFLKTVGVFAGITLIILFTLFVNLS